MAISSNRSPSPISSRTTNPNPRTPESSNNIRKSYSGNPLKKPLFVRNPKSFNSATPANSPAEFLQRSLSNREGLKSLRASCECKENEKDQNLKSVKLRSPSISGSKNFMAPTISAVSKIAASPRKKILGERNETVRSSDSSLTEKLSFAEKLESLELISCSQVPLKISSSDSVSKENLPILKEPESNLQMSSGFNEKPFINPKSSPSPLDLDPSLPPYDPKTNYLSPRPLFLCYKPNPRINKEPGFNYPGEGKRLEDSFTSDSCSDTENTEETQTSDSPKESEDESSEVISEEEKQTRLVVEEEETVRPKEISKSHSFVGLKTTPFLLVFIIASLCFTVTDSPLYNPSSLKDQTFSKVETSATIEVNPIDLFYNFKLWLESSTSHLFTMNSFPGVEKMGPHYAVNLTILDQEVLLQDYPAELYCYKESEEQQEKGTEEESEEVIVEEVKEEPPLISQAAEIKSQLFEPLQSQDEGDLDSHTNIDSKNIEEMQEENGLEPGMKGEIEEKEEDYVENQIEETVEEMVTEESSLLPRAAGTELKIVGSVEFQDEDDYVETQIEDIVEEMITEESSLIPPHEIVRSAEFQDEDGIVSHTTLEPVTLELTPHSSDSDTPQSSAMGVTPQNPGLGAVESVIHNLADKFVKETLLQISLVILTLITGSLFLYWKSKKTTSALAETTVGEQLKPNKLVVSSSSASIDSKTPEIKRFCSQNWAKEEEIDGQTGPLEMSSSFQNSSSCRQRGSERENEVESHERSVGRNLVRESSSEYSAGSPSYGSFTTYEKINKKHGCGEEMVTPVRRSNRIKKQIIST